MEIRQRLADLRGEMTKEGIDVYIVPTADFHQSEYYRIFRICRNSYYCTG